MQFALHIVVLPLFSDIRKEGNGRHYGKFIVVWCKTVYSMRLQHSKVLNHFTRIGSIIFLVNKIGTDTKIEVIVASTMT